MIELEEQALRRLILNICPLSSLEGADSRTNPDLAYLNIIGK